MSLEKLNKELYDPESGIENRSQVKSQFDLDVSTEADAREFGKEKDWMKVRKGLSPAGKKVLKITLLATGAAVLIAGAVFALIKYRQSSFNEERVTISIEGLEEIESNRLVTYKIKYKNNNRTSLKDAEILLNYSENFQPEEDVSFKKVNSTNGRIYIGEIGPYAEGETEVRGNFFAPKDYSIYLAVTLSYKPSSVKSTFQAKSQLGINIKTAPVELIVTAPLEAANGNRVEYVIDYKNSSSQSFSDLRLKIEYPSGFSFESAEPRSSEGNNSWYLGRLDPGQGGKITVVGEISGSKDETKIVKVTLGSIENNGRFVAYNEVRKNTKIASSPLSIAQTVNGLKSFSANPGETLNYLVTYRNDGKIGLRDVIITLEIKGEIIDIAKLSLEKGYYDSAKNTIVWKAPDIPELANLEPGQGGELRFSIPVLGRIPVENENDKNFAIISVAKIDSPDVPTSIGSNKIIASNTMEVNLNSKVILEVKGYYNDANIENFGPIPPEVNKETSYVIHWEVTNVSNEISDVRVTSFLPTGVKWLNKIYLEDDRVVFNERTNQVVWEIGKLGNGIGILEPKKEVSFQVSITPPEIAAGKEVRILNPSVITAKDLFTSKEIKSEVKEKTTALNEDASIDSMGYRVKGSN